MSQIDPKTRRAKSFRPYSAEGSGKAEALPWATAPLTRGPLGSEKMRRDVVIVVMSVAFDDEVWRRGIERWRMVAKSVALVAMAYSSGTPHSQDLSNVNTGTLTGPKIA